MVIALANVEIRPATPDQGARAAQLLYSTAAPIYDFLYGPDPAFRARILALQWQAEDSLLSHSHAVGAYDGDGTLLGVELGFDHGAEAAAFAGTYAVVGENTTPRQRRKIAAEAEQLIYLTPFTPDGNYCVHNLAVTDTGRIPGLGRQLLEGAFTRARANGYKAVCLDVIDSNPAVQFYLHLGMHLACEVRLPDLMEQHGMPSIYRMVMKL